MRYFQKETLRFWEVGYRLFRGKFLRFMSGPRGLGQVISGGKSKGQCTPGDSLINFAVPSQQTLSNKSLDPVYPGVLTDTIRQLALTLRQKTIKIGVDGKKIAQGKGKEMGDIDCWGFEPTPTFQERKVRYEQETKSVLELLDQLKEVEGDEVSGEKVVLIKEKLREFLVLIGRRIRNLREVVLKLSQGLERFMKMGESENGDWKKSRYAALIRTLKVNKFDANEAIENALRLISNICLCMEVLNEKQFLYSESGRVDMSRQDNYHQLNEISRSQHTRFVKQRSEKWHKIRKKAMVTGSTCNKALGLGKLKEQQAHFDKIVQGKETEYFDDKQLKNMEYGSEHKIDGVATVVGRVLPAVYPHISYFEEGCISMQFKEKPSFILVSPDGSMRTHADEEPVMMFENKCKTPNMFSTDVFYELPIYYVTQLMCEMKAYDYQTLLLSCWSPKSTTVFRVVFDEALWEMMWILLCTLYGQNEPKRPSRFPENINDLRSKVKEFTKQNAEFIGEFPSCQAYNLPKSLEANGSDGHFLKHQTEARTDKQQLKTDTLFDALH